ncbi:Dynein assembly factor 5, axonemal [Larimichthys crocea]|uniref:Uncharacterized protein n=1 Tax=Larimichthys crocea TaxID=215358 RepID=A0ACD3R7N0_LARCR|nr:Dynein assembly factor 5, axonemal [Larimichthys crocea]
MELYRQHMGQLLDWLAASVNTWSSYSPQRLQLNIIVIQSGQNHVPLPREMHTVSVFVLNFSFPDIKQEKLLSHFIKHQDKFIVTPAEQPEAIEAATRAGGIRALLLCLEEKLIPLVLSALDEDSQMGRLLACRSLSTTVRLIGTSLHPEALNKIYPELLKRLDDSSEEVRSVALQALGLWLTSLTKDYNPEFCTPHLQFLFQQLLLHLDDPDSSVQEQVLEVLKKGSLVHPTLLRREVEAVRDKQRSPLYCDQLLQHISSLPTETTAE